MKDNHIIKKIYLSCTSASFYTRIINERFLQSFLYLVILIIIITTPYSIYTGLNYNKILNNVITVIEDDNFPSFYLREGKLEIYGDNPFIYSENTYKSLKIIIDHTGTYTFNDLAGYRMGFLISPDNIIISQAGMLPQTKNYNEFLEFTLTKEVLVNYIQNTQPWFIYGAAILTLVFAFFSSLIKSLFSYLMINFFKKSLGVNLSSAQSYKIALYSMTFPLIIISILQFIPSLIPSTFHFGIFVFTNLMIIIKILKYFFNIKTNLPS